MRWHVPATFLSTASPSTMIAPTPGRISLCAISHSWVRRRATIICRTGKPLPRARCLVCSPRVPPSPRQLPAGLAPVEAMLLHYGRNAEPAPRQARPGGSHASARPKRRAKLPAGLAPAEAMLLHYSRNAEPAPRRARPGGSHASALRPKRRTSSPPGSPRRKPCFCTTAGTPSQLPAGLAPAGAGSGMTDAPSAETWLRRGKPGGGRIRNDRCS